MAYSRWSDSVWYTYWAADMSECGEEVLAIQRRGGEGDKLVWDEHNPDDMSDQDIADCVPWDSFTGVTDSERKELISIVRSFFEDVVEETKHD